MPLETRHPDLIRAIESGDQNVLEYIGRHQFTAEDVDQIGALMLQHDLLVPALRLFDQLLQMSPQRAQSHVNMALAQAQSLQLEEAQACFQRALNLNPHYVPAAQGLQEIERRLQNRAQTPGIYLITVPKSGSVFLMNTFLRGLDLRFIQTASRVYMPEDMAIYQHLEQLGQGGGWISQEHLPAHKWNLYVLERLLDRWIVHVRDPRQAMLSWTHHCDDYHRQGLLRYVEMYLPEPVEAYFAWSLEHKLDWQIEHYLPLVINFIADWLQVSQSPQYAGRILLTQYEDFIQDNDAFIKRILDFYGIPEEHFHFPKMKRRQGAYHYRQGRADEWREVFSAVQVEKATTMIPHSLQTYFNWG